MAGITKRELSVRRQRLRDELPNHGWDYVKAGIAAGYSPSYARARLKKYTTKGVNFCQQVAAKRREIEARTEDLREKAMHKLITTLERPNLRPSEIARLVEVMGKMNGWMSETRVLETTSRQRQLTEAEQQEARRLAILRFNPQYALPGDEDYEGTYRPAEAMALARKDSKTRPAGKAVAPPSGPEEAFPSLPRKFSEAEDNLDETYAEGVQKSRERAQPAGGPGQ